MRILIVEDEPDIAVELRKYLEAERHEVLIEPTGEEAFFRINTETFDLIILDHTLPGRSGSEVLRAVRERRVKIPVLLMLESTTETVAAGTDANDYVLKPFSSIAFLKSVRILLKAHATEKSSLRVGDLNMDLGARRLTRGAKSIRLTVREFDLLEYFMRSQDQVVSYQVLAREVWKQPYDTNNLHNKIHACVSRLRRKVELDPAVRLIHTVRNRGFMLQPRGTPFNNECITPQKFALIADRLYKDAGQKHSF